MVQRAGIKFKNKIRKEAEIYSKDAKLRSILWNKNLYLRNVLLTLIKLKSTSKTEVSLNKFKCLENRSLNKKKWIYILFPAKSSRFPNKSACKPLRKTKLRYAVWCRNWGNESTWCREIADDITILVTSIVCSLRTRNHF